MTEDGVGLADRVRMRGGLGPDDAARLLLPVAEALAAMHAAATAHGAVSPAAVHIDGTGGALLLDPTRAAGDPRLAWSSVSAEPPSAADDVRAFAVLLLFVTTGRTLGPGDAAAAAPRELGWLTPLVQLALATDPRERPTTADVVDYLRARVPAQRRPRVSTVALAVAGAALVVGLGAAGAALLLTGTEDEGAHPRVGGTATRGSTAVEDGGPRATDPAASTASDEDVSAAELETFARRYVATASRDPRRGFGMLTRAYQQDSPRYREVWSAIRDPRILVIDPDPAALSVSYTYRYDLPDGDRRTEDVTLRLVERHGRLLIAGASAR